MTRRPWRRQIEEAWDTVLHAERQTEEEGQRDMGQDKQDGAPDWVREELHRRQAGQDTGPMLLSNTEDWRSVTPVPAELAAFMAVVQDRPEDAKDIVSRMSRRDRALLSFYLRELESAVDTQDMKDSL